MEIKGSNYRVWDDPAGPAIYFEGILRLGDPAQYQPILDLCNQSVASASQGLTLDVTALSFMDDPGIEVLYKVAVALRKKGEWPLLVRGSKDVPWHGKTLPNLKKYNANFTLELIA